MATITDFQTALAGLKDRVAQRADILAASTALTALFILLGGLSLWVAFMGLTALAVWVLYGTALPIRPTGQQSSFDHRVRGGAASGGLSIGSLSQSSTDVWTDILTGFPEAAMLLDRQSRVLAANAVAGMLLPMSVGRHLSYVIRAPELLAAVERARAGGGAQSFQVQTTVPTRRLLRGIVTPLKAMMAQHPDDPDCPVMIVVLLDQTAEQHLSQLRSDFVANASHELRTPLASLKGFVETLQGPAKDDPAALQRFLPIMQTQASRMSRLIDDLLSLSRIEMREHVPPSEYVDLAGVADEVVNALQLEAKARSIRITLTKTGGEAWVTGDRDELVQVVQNLLQNAIKYGKAGGQISVTVTADVTRVSVSVADDGIGIAPEHLPRLTERFYRVNAKDSRERGGTGLGLAIVKHIVNRHRGELRINSTVGIGSNFSVVLPGRSAPTARKEK